MRGAIRLAGGLLIFGAMAAIAWLSAVNYPPGVMP